MKNNLISTKTLALVVVVFMCLSIAVFINARAQAPASIEKFTQLQPFRVLNAGEQVYLKIGTIGTDELNPCVAAVKVWNPQNTRLQIYTTCRIQADGYAAVVVRNEGAEAVGIFDKVVVAVTK